MPKGVYPRASLEDRFWAKVDKTPGFGPEGTCWEWTSQMYASGYGCIWYNGKGNLSHRIAWFIHYRELPSLSVMHKCDNPKCVRIDHLTLGTHRDNMDDMMAKKRHGFGEQSVHSKLTEEQILEIRQSPESNAALGRKYGVHHTHISRIKHNKCWRHM